MNLTAHTRNCLCKTYRAAGLPKEKALKLLDEVDKWVRCNGVEWTVERMKNLHHSYIAQLSGERNTPEWIAFRKSGKPKGPFKWAWETSNKQLALAILSSHTVFTNDTVTKKQLEKLHDGLHSKKVPTVFVQRKPTDLKSYKVPLLKFHSPAFGDLTATSIPVGFTSVNLRNPTRAKVVKAYCGSWDWVPEETVRFIRSANLWHHAPLKLQEKSGSTSKPVGTLVCLQEESLKARWISNPNRITQAFLRPLGDAWEHWLEKLPTDCTKDQWSGVMWAESKLRSGVKLAGADLTSATDKLNLDLCLDLVNISYLGVGVTSKADCEIWLGTQEPHCLRYALSIGHFREISRGTWLRDGKREAWDVGWPLGTRPSFPLLGLTNNLVAKQAALDSDLNWKDAFRVCGDDIIMDARMFDRYVTRIQQLGGEINPSKSLVSNTAVEFVGHVITGDGSFLKRIKAQGLSDNSFMLCMSLLGEQAKYLLKGRQRKVWEQLKYIPGVAVDGPYSRQSYGESVANRYHWYLKHVKPEKIQKDEVILTGSQMARDMVQALNEQGLAGTIVQERYIPGDIWAWNNQATTAFKKSISGDPRLVDGMTTLESGERTLEKGTFKPYQDFKREVAMTIASDPAALRISSGMYGEEAQRELVEVIGETVLMKQSSPTPSSTPLEELPEMETPEAPPKKRGRR